MGKVDFIVDFVVVVIICTASNEEVKPTSKQH